jgi:6-phosphogluconate dehydrogenase
VKIGMVGLGRMGGNMAERLRRGGHEVVGYDTAPDTRDVGSLEELVAALSDQDRRVVWVMVPAGRPHRGHDRVRSPSCSAPGTWSSTAATPTTGTRSAGARAALAARGIGFVDAGVSGGVWGLDARLLHHGRWRHQDDIADLRRSSMRWSPPAASRTSAPSAPATSRRWCTTASSTP